MKQRSKRMRTNRFHLRSWFRSCSRSEIPVIRQLVQVVFSFQNIPTLTEFTLSGLRLSFPPVEVTTSECDLLLDMSEGTVGIGGTLEYNPDLFDRSTIVRMVEQFRNLLEGIAV